MSVYVIAIGGTGAKFIEAVSHLAAAGLYTTGGRTEKIEVLFVDPDKGNGNLKAADSAIKTYRKCAETIDQGINSTLNWWMQTEVNFFQQGLWSPFREQDEFRLRDAFRYDNYNGDKESIRHLFDVLYTEKERDVLLKDGFLGRPAIGSAIMTQLRQNATANESWNQLIEKIDSDLKTEPNNPPQVFLCGSIFGGTGASGFPTLGRLIAKELGNTQRGNLLSKVKLGGLLMLPYFRFASDGKEEKDAVFARSEEFPLKTEASLRYYATQDLKFDTVYLLGLPTMTNVENRGKGGGDQRNNPHILELYAGLALRDFIFTEKPDNKQVILLSRKQANEIIWDDVPDRDETRQKLTNAAQFAYIWLSAIVPDLEYAKTKLRDVNFAIKFYNKDGAINQSGEWDKINAIKDWSEAYLKWLGILHENGSGLKLFNTTTFYDQGKLKLDRVKLPDIVGQAKDKDINVFVLSNLSTQKIQGISDGTTGLAKALYRLLSEKNI